MFVGGESTITHIMVSGGVEEKKEREKIARKKFVTKKKLI